MNLAHDAIAQMQAKISSSTIQHFLIETFSGIHTVARNIFKSAKQPTCSHSHFVFMNHFTVSYNEYLQRVLSLQFCCFFYVHKQTKMLVHHFRPIFFLLFFISDHIKCHTTRINYDFCSEHRKAHECGG